MKVSILTYHWEDNYGATMQAYATYCAIWKLGHTPEFIDLRLPYSPSLKSRLVFGLKRLRFNSFRKKYFKNLTRTYWSVDELRCDPPESDCYLVGSDQTWNPQIGRELLPAFFLTFGDDAVRRISYATSIGLNEWEESEFITNEEIGRALEKFQKILLREDRAIQIAKDVFGAEAAQVIDPVLLFPSYPELTGKIEPSNELVVYKLIDDARFYGMAKELASAMGQPIRSIGSVRRLKGYRISYPETVENWMKRIAGAFWVLTDSFHGTVISLLYHRPFVVYVGNPSRISRIVSLLSQLGLSDRILTKDSTLGEFVATVSRPIDWANVDRTLARLRQDSLDKLKAALG